MPPRPTFGFVHPLFGWTVATILWLNPHTRRASVKYNVAGQPFYDTVQL